MIHFTQDEDVEVADIAGQKERHDLTPAILELFVTTCPSGEDHMHIPWPVAFAGDVHPRTEASNPLGRRAIKHGTIRRRQPDKVLELSDEVTQRPRASPIPNRAAVKPPSITYVMFLITDIAYPQN